MPGWFSREQREGVRDLQKKAKALRPRPHQQAIISLVLFFILYLLLRSVAKCCLCSPRRT